MPTPMDCKQVFERLDDYLDRRLSPREVALVEEHLRACEHCALDYRFEREVIDTLRDRIRRITVPDSLRRKVLDSLRKAEEL
jgi:anti-sigma factor (TIGR02949 family)